MNIKSDCKRDQIRQFIEAYRNLPELWDSRDPRYFHLNAKKAGYKLLTEKLRSFEPDADEDVVKRKINCLRTSFRKEMLKVEMLKKTGHVYEPSLWYYNDMIFIKDLKPKEYKRKVIDDTSDHCSILIRSTPTPELVFEETYSPKKKQKTEAAVFATKCSRRKTALSSKRNFGSQISNSESENNDVNAALILAKNYAFKLGRVVCEEQQMLADKLINHILFDAQLGLLSRHSHLVHQPQHSMANSAASKRNPVTEAKQQYDSSDVEEYVTDVVEIPKSRYNNDLPQSKIARKPERLSAKDPEWMASKGVQNRKSIVATMPSSTVKVAVRKTANALTPREEHNDQSKLELKVAACTSLDKEQPKSQNDFEIMGTFWASEVQKMSKEQQIYAKKAIHDIIFEGQIGALHCNSALMKSKSRPTVNYLVALANSQEEPTIFEPDVILE